MNLAAAISTIELISGLVERLIDTKAAKAVGSLLGTNLLNRGELTDEQRAEVIRVIASYDGMAAQLQAEIDAAQK